MVTEDDIRRAIPANAVAAGRAYFQQGRVQSLKPATDGSFLRATVRGSTSTPYRLDIALRRSAKGAVGIDGECTCPVGYNCKHVAAALLAYRARAPQPTPLQAPQPPPAATTADRLPHEIETWLRSLAAAQEDESEDYPPTIRKRLLYVLDRPAGASQLTLALHAIDLNRDGVPTGAAKPQTRSRLLATGQQPKYLRPSDRSILDSLPEFGDPKPATLAALLPAILATGRARWRAPDGPALTLGPPAPASVVWRLDDQGLQHPELDPTPPKLPLHLGAFWYVDPVAATIGRLHTDLPARVVKAMLAAPPLVPAQAERIQAELRTRWPSLALPAPKAIAPPQPLNAPLQPHLHLFAAQLPFDPARAALGQYRAAPPDAGPTPLARLSWRYGPIELSATADHPPHPVVQHGGALHRIERDPRAEQLARRRLSACGLSAIQTYVFTPNPAYRDGDLVMADMDPAAWIDFMLEDVPMFRAEGWTITLAEDFPLHLVTPTGDIEFNLSESAGIDWFDLQLGVMVDGERISLVPPLLNLISGGAIGLPGDGNLLIPLPDGRLLHLTLDRLGPILAPLLELFSIAEPGSEPESLRLSRRAAADLAELESAATQGVVWQGGDAIRALGRQLRAHQGIPHCKLPPGFTATLRPYQQHGLNWLQLLASAGLGGVLADDMGLGKTVQALAHIAVEQDTGRLDRPALVVCPTSLIPNWRAEAARFAPTLRTLVLHGPDRAQLFPAIPRHDLVITTYPLLTRDHAVLVEQPWHLVILDEAQTIKNPLATTSKLARTLRARQRLCLSGTPLENHLGELWSLFDFLAPGLLGDQKSFGRRFRTPIEKNGNSDRQALLARRVAPFLLRRTKAEVAADLPPKTEIAEPVDMEPAQRAIYEAIRIAMHAKVRAAVAKRGLGGAGIIILDALLKLRQACCDPRLVKLASAKSAKAGSAKLDRLLEMLPQLLEQGRRILLFSQFTAMLALIQTELDRMQIPYVLLTGDTKDRTTPVKRFQSGAVPLFLISLKAGGTGLNLTAADTVIHYDPWWNPAVEDQATDRAHRIGQDKPVFVHRLITTGTIEEKMETLKQRKQALAAGILGAAGGTAAGLQEADLEMLFG
jgi:superfamily II DNA or RNA helicase